MLKKIILTSAFAASAFAILTANAALPSGLYVSGQVGYADTQLKSRLSNLGPSLANDGLAGRLAIGYKLTPNLALELGYLQLANAEINFGAPLPPPQKEVNTGVLPSSYSLSNKQHAVDLVAKGILPITSNVNIYGKLGAAYLTTQIQRKTTYDGIPITQDLNSRVGIDKRQWAPEVAIGMGYDITPNVSVDTSLTHIQTIGNHRAGNIDLLAVGVSYNFG
jgi:opacity protein-like surface antigen